MLDIAQKGVRFTWAVAKGFATAYQIGAFNEPPPRERLPKHIQAFCQGICRAIGVGVEVVGEMPKTHGLWACNHISWVDIPAVGAHAPVFFLSKAEIGQWPLVGHLVKAGGTLFIKRGSGDTGSVTEQISEFLRAGFSVIFFPEATTTDGRAIKKIYGKLLQSAMTTGLPIQPIVLCYTDGCGNLSNELPYCGDMSLKESLWRILRTKGHTAHLMALEPIDPADMRQSDLTALLKARMDAGLIQLHQTVLS